MLKKSLKVDGNRSYIRTKITILYFCHLSSDFQLHTLMLKFTNYWHYTINIKNSLNRSHKRILDDSDLELFSFRGCRTLFKLFPMPFTTYT